MTAIYQCCRYIVPEPTDGEPLRWHPSGRPDLLDLVPLAVEEQVWTALKAGASEVQVEARGVGMWRSAFPEVDAIVGDKMDGFDAAAYVRSHRK